MTDGLIYWHTGVRGMDKTCSAENKDCRSSVCEAAAAAVSDFLFFSGVYNDRFWSLQRVSITRRN